MTIQPQKITIWQLNMHKSEEARDALVKHALNQKTLPILLLTSPAVRTVGLSLTQNTTKYTLKYRKNQDPERP
jgi:hypothetical protein